MPDRGRATVFERRFVASLYDLDVRLMSRHLWGTSVADQVRFLADVVAGARGAPALEVPAGTGLLLDRAVPRRDGLVVAVDLSGAMLRRARRRVGDRAVYVVADVVHLPFRAEAFGAVHSANGFHLFPDRPAAASELARVVRRAGIAGITTWTDQGRRLAGAYQRALARRGLINQPTSVAEHASVFEAAGFAQHSAALGGTLLRWLGTRT